MKKILIISILAMFVIAGCSSSNDSKTSAQSPFIGGTAGLIINFQENSPPQEVYAGGENPFDVVVKLKNDGEHNIPKDQIAVTLTGINAQEFGQSEADFVKSPADDVLGKRIDNGEKIDSNPIYVEFIDLNHNKNFLGNSFTIRAEVCYKYETDAVSKICVRENNLDNKEGVCKVSEAKTLYNSGAPLQITSFKEEARAKNKIAFSFTVAHKGNGQVYMQESVCGKEDRNKKQDKVWVEVKTDLSGLECPELKDGTATSGYTNMYGGDKIITCMQTVETKSNYENPVEIKLVYDYKDNKETSIKVKGSGNPDQ